MISSLPGFAIRPFPSPNNEWDIYPQADEDLLAFVRTNTRIPLSTKSWEEAGCRYRGFRENDPLAPFFFMTGHVGFNLTERESNNLLEFFKRGGFIYADDCVPRPGSTLFYQAVKREFGKIKGIRMERMPANHEIYQCFYEFRDGWAPYIHKPDDPGWDVGFYYGNHIVAFLTAGDIHCGWNDVPDNPKATMEACDKMAVNIIIYALTH